MFAVCTLFVSTLSPRVSERLCRCEMSSNRSSGRFTAASYTATHVEPMACMCVGDSLLLSLLWFQGTCAAAATPWWATTAAVMRVLCCCVVAGLALQREAAATSCSRLHRSYKHVKTSRCRRCSCELGIRCSWSWCHADGRVAACWAATCAHCS